MADHDFSAFANVKIGGADIETLTDDERDVLYTEARYCQAMVEADVDVLRAIVAEEKVFVHMSGKRQTREEYFSDIVAGRLRYFHITIADPVIAVQDERAKMTYTSILDAMAYGAKGVYSISGTHFYERSNGEWIAVDR